MAEAELHTEDRVLPALEDFRVHAPGAFVAPESALLTRRGQIRTRQLRGIAVVAAAAITLAMSLAVEYIGRPTGAESVPSADSIAEVDWANTAIALPSMPDTSCPSGQQRLQPWDDGRLGRLGQVPTTVGGVPGAFQVIPTSVAYGDLTGDGQPEAALVVRCLAGATGGLPQEGARVLVVAMRPDRSLYGLGYTGTPNAEFRSLAIKDGRLLVQMRYDRASEMSWGTTAFDVAFTQTIAWDGTAFRLMSGRSEPLRFKPSKDGLGSPIHLVSILRGSTVVCPGADIRLAFGQAASEGFTYQPLRRPIRVDLDRDGNEELVVGMRCSGHGYDAASLYVFEQGPDGFVPRDVPLANDGRYELLGLVSADDEHVIISIKEISTGTEETRSLTWDGHAFGPSIGAHSRQ